MAKPGPTTEPPEEDRAAAIVAAITACATHWLDRGDGVQRPDYSLLDESGEQIGVLEVTTLSSRSHNSFFSRKAGKHRSWSDPNLRCNWLVSVDSSARELRTLRGPLTTSLPVLEAEGFRFASSQPANYLGTVTIPFELTALGIVELTAFGSEGDGHAAVFVNVMPVGGPYGVESATTALEAVLDLPDNRKKLDLELARRELFVWVDPPSAAAAALSTFSVDPWRTSVTAARPPRLPPEATGLWAALWSDGEVSLAHALWRGDADGWEVIDPPVR